MIGRSSILTGRLRRYKTNEQEQVESELWIYKA
jgi:hypothetical protein